jgi:hypothetical protein
MSEHNGSGWFYTPAQDEGLSVVLDDDTVLLLVVVHVGDRTPGFRDEKVPRGLGPSNVLDDVRAVVVASHDDLLDQRGLGLIEFQIESVNILSSSPFLNSDKRA